MAQKRPSGPLIALCLAALVGLAVGYGAEARADQRGVTVSGGNSDIARPGDGGRAERREIRRTFDSRRRDDFRATRRDRGYRDRDRGFRDIGRPNRRVAAYGSFVHVYATDRYDPGATGFVQTPAGRTGFTRDGFGGIGFFDHFGERAGAFPSEPRIIDIEAERLDRRAIGPSGLDVVHTGGAKIIRIAPGYGRTPPRQASLSGTPLRASRGDLQPWSPGWLKHCMNAYHSFDPELGTYRAGDGRVRFCQPD